MQLAGHLRALFVVLVLFGTSAGALAADASCPGGYSNQFRLNGHVKNPDRFRLIDMQYRPSAHITVSYFSGSQGLVTDAVVVTDSGRKNDILRKYAVVKATDCYEVIVSVANCYRTSATSKCLLLSRPVTANRWMLRRE